MTIMRSASPKLSQPPGLSRRTRLRPRALHHRDKPGGSPGQSFASATLCLVLCLAALLGPVAPAARGDGGALCLRERAGNYQVAVFVAPTPLRAGPVDVSVLVQQAAGGGYVADAEVLIRVTALDSVPATREYRATAGAATNKLFRAAQFDIPEPGRWELGVRIDGPHGPAEMRGVVIAEPTMPRAVAMWPWIAWPAGVVLVFGVHLLLVRRHERRAVAGVTAAPGPCDIAG